MKKLISEAPEGIDEELEICAIDEPGPGGAFHVYVVANPQGEPGSWTQGIHFQKGPWQPGRQPNGLTIESLLTICIDRLESFQAGPFPCKENQQALSSLRKARKALYARTADRLTRGVEGRTKP